MITLSRYNRLETLWDEIKHNSKIPEEVRMETEQKLLENRVEVRVNYRDSRINEVELPHQLSKYNQTIAMVEPLVNDVSDCLEEDVKFLVVDTSGVIIASHAKDVIGLCCPAAELVNNNTDIRDMMEQGCTLEVKYDNGIHSQMVPIFDEQGQLQFCWGISAYRPLPTEASILLYLATQLFQQRYKYILIVDEYTSSLMNAMSDCAVLLDEKGRILNINDHCKNLLKLDNKGTVKGMPFNYLMSGLPSTQEMFQSLTRETLNLRIWEEDICCRITHRQPICTSYGTHALFLFNRLSNTGRHLQLITADSPKDAFASIIGNSPQISELINQARKAAGYKATVLIEGESGTGKELIAQAIHKESGRSGKFIAINCGAIPSELIQSELFGYDEGAFTGAKKKGNPGKLEMADKGTVFLDEIGEMPLDMQVNLLRFLQDKTITRVGGNQSHKIDVRIIAATNRNLKEEVEKGNFREDLYYRLNVIHLQVPPLRERREDIPVLAHFFVEKLSQEYGIDEPIISAAAMRTLLDYDWPGNVREMENQIERAMILSAGYELRFDNLISSVSDNAEGIEGITADKERIEKEGIENYLRQYQGNISHTAKALGITRQTLYRKIKSLNIQREKLGVTPMDASHQAPNEKS